MALATAVVVGVPLVMAARGQPATVRATPGSITVWRTSAGDGPFLVTLETGPADRAVVRDVTFDVVGDGEAEAVVCEWADGPPTNFGVEPADAPAVQAACARVRPLEPGETVGTAVQRSLMVRFEATGPADPTLCTLSAVVAVPGSEQAAPTEAPIGVAISRQFGQPSRPFAGCPDPPPA